MCYIISPPLTLEYLRGVRQEILGNISPDHVKYPPPPRVFLASKRDRGGSSGCQTLALAFQDSQKRNPTAAMEFLAWWLLEL